MRTINNDCKCFKERMIMAMDVNRAQEILQAKDIIEVRLNGQSVWIEEVDQKNETAKVRLEGNPNDKRIVAVDELTEIQH